MKDLFTYGSLMCEDIMTKVSGNKFSYTAGILKGYRRLCIKNEYYPAIIPDSKYIVEGIIYFNLNNSAWKRLDRFEGEMYSREPVKLELNNGKVLIAYTYVFNPFYKDYLEEKDWDFSEFLNRGKTNFVNKYKGWHSI